jgi:hypothetical protein
MIQGNMIAGPVTWHPRSYSFDGPPAAVITSDFTGNIVDLGSARGSAHDNQGATVDWVGRQSSTAQTAHSTQGTHGSVGFQPER